MRNLETGNVKRKAHPVSLDKGFLYCPEPEEQVKFPVSLGRRQLLLFSPAKDTLDEEVQITVSDALFHVNAYPSFRRDGDKSMPAAMTDVEADGSRLPVYKSNRLAMHSGLEIQPLIFTVEPVGDGSAKSRATKSKPSARPSKQESLQPPQLPFIKPGQGGRFAGRILT